VVIEQIGEQICSACFELECRVVNSNNLFSSGFTNREFGIFLQVG